jgi:YbbR domain-containing protein
VIYNIPPGQAVTTDPATIQIEITGPPEDIDLLNRNALIVSVDFRQISSDSLAQLKVDCPSNFRVKRQSADSVRILTVSDAHPGN